MINSVHIDFGICVVPISYCFKNEELVDLEKKQFVSIKFDFFTLA